MPDRAPRLAPLTAAERTPHQQQLIDHVGSELNIFTTMIRNPELFEKFHVYAGRLLRGSGLTGQDRETLILRTAFRCRNAYEWSQHVVIAAREGLDADAVRQLQRERPELADGPALLCRAADELTARRYLEQDTWDALAQRYDERQLIEICLLVGNYAMIAGLLASLQVELQDGQERPDWAI